MPPPISLLLHWHTGPTCPSGNVFTLTLTLTITITLILTLTLTLIQDIITSTDGSNRLHRKILSTFSGWTLVSRCISIPDVIGAKDDGGGADNCGYKT